MKEISIRLEGGIGDTLLANRFVHAIQEKYPNSKLSIYFDSADMNLNPLRFLKIYWPTLYKDARLAPKRLSQNFKIKSQFGEETYNAAIENQSDKSIYACADKFYDLCLDRLEWLDEDFDWYRYFYFFPSPEVKPTGSNEEPFILANLFARPNSPFSLEKWYVKRLLEEVSKISKVIIVTTQENKQYYDFLPIKNVEIRAANLDEVFYLSSVCSGFIGVDSGIRCMSYYFGKPTFYFSTFCKEYGNVLPSHLLRWIIFEKNVFPMNYDIYNVMTILKTAYTKRAGALMPYLKLDNFDDIIIKRKYTVV